MDDQAEQMSESEFRTLARGIYERVQGAFDDVDPDEAECEESQGSLTISLPDGAKWILSMQPPVRQLWLAVASIGRAFHFDYDAAADAWKDDKGEGVELLSYLEGLLQELAGVQAKF